MRIILLTVCMVLLLTSCAQVPKQSVELSATIGRDISEIKRSHLAFIDLYYNNLLQDINRFIDDVYLPFQIQQTLGDPEWKAIMLNTIESASRPDPSGDKQKQSLATIQAFLQIIQEEVEDYRKLKLKPIQTQHQTIKTRIDQAYNQVHYANSIVTGHLASVVKIHETQNELLAKANVQDLRSTISTEALKFSEKIEALMQKAQSGEEKLNSIINKFNDITQPK